jgi:sporulation protein YlmC with PRC-barrel domain
MRCITFFWQARPPGANNATLENMMKNLMLGTAMAVVLGAPVVAQDMFRTQMDPVAITASDFIGKRVYAAEAAVDTDEYAGIQDGWEDIGEINDIVLTREGTVDAVLVDIGGFLGMGERQVALGMENIRFVSDSATADNLNDFFLVVNADRTILEGAPEYTRMDAAALTEEAPAETNIPVVDQATGATRTDGQDVVAEDAPMVDGYAMVDAATITATDLVGARVYGPNNEDVGEISDVVMNDAGQTGQIIVDVGGFLGLGEKPVALESTELTFLRATDGDALRVRVDMTQEELEALPAVSM